MLRLLIVLIVCLAAATLVAAADSPENTRREFLQLVRPRKSRPWRAAT